MKILISALLLILTLQVSFGQATLKPILQDEFSLTSCEDFSGRASSLINSLKDNPNSKGYFIFFYPKDKVRTALYLERIILAELNYSKIKTVTIVYKKVSDPFKIQFWFVPNGAETSFSSDEKADFTLVNPNKPVKFTDTREILCSELGQTKQFAEILLANPDLGGNVVINAKSKIGFLKSQKSLQNELMNDYQVPKTKIKFFFFKNSYDYVEYWFVPKRRKL